ncbi:hypothetical protein EDB85DRAFT_1896080 [Lactarius pseudohatsudake]|nr:hypothetical protein EDB85DRAFT_1896080 [Lactarius pseudohatsudake]
MIGARPYTTRRRQEPEGPPVYNQIRKIPGEHRSNVPRCDDRAQFQGGPGGGADLVAGEYQASQPIKLSKAERKSPWKNAECFVTSDAGPSGPEARPDLKLQPLGQAMIALTPPWERDVIETHLLAIQDIDRVVHDDCEPPAYCMMPADAIFRDM